MEAIVKMSIKSTYILLLLSFFLFVSAEEGVSTNATTLTYTQLVTTTVTSSEFTTYITFSSNSNSTYYYTINNATYTITEDEEITLTNCPCTFTTQSVVITGYTDTEYASDYWVTVNASSCSTAGTGSNSTSSESILTGTFIQSTSSATSGTTSIRGHQSSGIWRNISIVLATAVFFVCIGLL